MHIAANNKAIPQVTETTTMSGRDEQLSIDDVLEANSYTFDGIQYLIDAFK
jgi:hypothetical protein